MLGFFFLLIVFLNGLSISSALKIKDNLLIYSFTFGSIASISLIYFLNSYFVKNLDLCIALFFLVSIFHLILNFRSNNLLISSLLKNRESLSVFIIVLLISSYFFNKSFAYADKSFLISSNTYLDFGAHIPFVRSFSLGSNFPAEVPFFGNSGLIYHFMFDMYAGLLERLGINIALAFNLLSSFFFASLLVLIFHLGMELFKDKRVGLLSSLLFIFTPSIAFIQSIRENGLNLSSYWHNSHYLLDSIFGENTVSVFFTLNTFTNQRHLILGILFVLLIISYLMKKKLKDLNGKEVCILGILIGFLPYWHTQIFISLMIVLFMLFVISRLKNKSLMMLITIAMGIALPQLISIAVNSTNEISFNPGFMVSDRLSLVNLVKYWIANLGVSIPLFLIGFLAANRKQKMIFFVFFPLFLIPNIFQFGRDIFDNHKFFNLWIISYYFFVSLGLLQLTKRKLFSKILSVFLLLFIFSSGILNLLVIKNDVKETLPDYKQTSFGTFLANLPSGSLILSNGEIYDPASIVGHKTYLGRGHYVYLYGGDPGDRLIISSQIFSSDNSDKLIEQERISYIIIYKEGFAKNSKSIEEDNFKRYRKIYEDKDAAIYEI
jgi:hypothetical protein